MNLCAGGRRAPLIFNLESKWRQLACLTPRPLFSRGRIPGTHWIWMQVCPRPSLDILEQTEVFVLPEFEPGIRECLFFNTQRIDRWPILLYTPFKKRLNIYKWQPIYSCCFVPKVLLLHLRAQHELRNDNITYIFELEIINSIKFRLNLWKSNIHLCHI